MDRGGRPGNHTAVGQEPTVVKGGGDLGRMPAAFPSETVLLLQAFCQ